MLLSKLRISLRRKQTQGWMSPVFLLLDKCKNYSKVSVTNLKLKIRYRLIRAVFTQGKTLTFWYTEWNGQSRWPRCDEAPLIHRKAARSDRRFSVNSWLAWRAVSSLVHCSHCSLNTRFAKINLKIRWEIRILALIFYSGLLEIRRGWFEDEHCSIETEPSGQSKTYSNRNWELQS